MSTIPPTPTAMRALSGWSLRIAGVVLVAFAALVWFMTSQVGADETTWTRLAWLFSSVEAVAFGAAGAVFGSSVQRERAVNAEKRADANQQDATNGRALAAVIKGDTGPAEADLDVGSRSLDEPEAGTKSTGGLFGGGAGSVNRYGDLARSLFPD